MQIRPLGSRILVRPDEPPPVSDLIIAPDDAAKNPEMSGEVIALGDGPERDARLKRDIMKDVRNLVDEALETFRQHKSALAEVLHDWLGTYGATRPTEYDVKVGDHLVFPWNVGTRVSCDGEDYILLTEDDPVAVLESEEENAA